jgi:Zinc carboxypeptidase
MKRIRLAFVAAAGSLLVAAAPAAAAPCDPFGTPTFRGEVPTPKQVIGIDLGERDVTTAESDAYVAAVDAASPRVISGTLAQKSVQGRDLDYAIVGHPDRVTPNGLARIRASAAQLMDPSTRPRDARAITRRDPAILWIAGNVHGGEESGTDASLRVLWELADRSDCAAEQILDNSIVVILPTQNPDGRELDTRRNAYGFDMNRDWFARTQPETEGKVELVRRYPPVLFIDAHEMGNQAGYFFPPNADPIYHEITGQAVDWINNLYGASMRAVFDARGIPYFNYDVYDLFYQGYGDTVPATGFGAAGMTFEKTSGHPTDRRVFEQYLTQWTSLSAAATNKRSILEGWHEGWVEAERQGRRGELEPNEVFEPENEVQQEVPDIRVRHYFIRNDDPGKAREVQSLVRRLQRMDVRVRRLTRPLPVDDYKPYGRAERWEVLPAGTYVVSMEQRQKHWVQAMLNEDTYVPFPYFYDVTAWSGPLLFNVEGGYSGLRLEEMRTAPVPAQPDPGSAPLPPEQPEVALYSMSPQFTRGIESGGWLRYLLDRWGVQYREVSAEDIKAGALEGADVLLVPDGYATLDPDFPEDPYGLGDLGPEGQAAIRTWVEEGGRYVGWLDGAVLAAGVGISSATFESAEENGISSPGALIRTTVARRSPLADGVGRSAYAFWDSRYVMQANGAAAPVRFPAAAAGDFFVSGYADGAEALGGTAAVIDEPVGDGRTVAFGFEPNFRAFTDGTQRLLRNAMFGEQPAAFEDAAAEPATIARAEARQLSAPHDPVRLVVAAGGERAAAAVLDARGLRHRVVRTTGRVSFTIANPGGASGDEIPWARDVEASLKARGVPVVMYQVP